MFDHDTRLSIVTKVAEAGIFYEDAFAKAAAPEWNSSFPISDVQLFEDTLELHTDSFQRYRAVRLRLQAVLKERPRGTWATATYTREDGHVEKASFMANGAGGVFSGSASKAYDFKALSTLMAEVEIYDARKEHERLKIQSEAIEHLQSTNWRVGTKLRNVRISGLGCFSTVVISAVRTSGHVEMIGARRGSRKRWEISVLAQGIIQLCEDVLGKVDGRPT
ncbi:hypothetical protein XP420_15790 [Xanthomonas perforans]|uniref:hypothetical protein n=1 Tax=Xanthomonas perforans TaxID=442694 RepID=UPI00062D3729|nr:hypothetical protein [Xanthomonas perforans]KLC04070.1 hypothetical protein XP420_15790 [Xanthomonas perforans]